VLVVDPIAMDQPKTKVFFDLLKALKADQGCVVALDTPNEAVFKSARNIPKVEVRQVHELNAYVILRRRKVLFSKRALEAVAANSATYRDETPGLPQEA
jgi:large subunit ribosomal protein L4